MPANPAVRPQPFQDPLKPRPPLGGGFDPLHSPANPPNRETGEILPPPPEGGGGAGSGGPAPKLPPENADVMRGPMMQQSTALQNVAQGPMQSTTVASGSTASAPVQTTTTTAPPASAGVYAGVDPSRTFDAAGARAHLEGILGRPMTQEEMQKAVQLSGWDGKSPITGEMVNKLIQAGAGAAGKPFSPFAAPPTGGGGLPQGFEDQIYKTIQDLLNPKGYDPNDPTNLAQKSVFSAQQNRAAERRRAAAAERAAARGELGTGGFDVTVDQIENDRGMAESAFEADLMRSELEGQRARLMQALEMGRGIIGDKETRALQEKLGLLDAEIRKMGIKQQGELGRGDLLLRMRQLAQGDRHFYDQLGSDNSRWLADFNQRSLRDILGAF